MKKIALIFAVLLMVVSTFVSCAKEEAAPETFAPTAEVTAEVTEAPTAAPTETPADIPADASPTTGLPGHPEYKPVIVQIENEEPARPQAGLQDADIVYETMIEGNDTRFTCLYNDIYPEEVGPLRSARYYHQRIQQEWDALFVHMGGAPDPNFPVTYIYGESGDHIKQRLDGTRSDPPESQLWRRTGTGKAVEHTAYVNVAEIAETYNYEPVQRQPFKYYPLEDYADNATAVPMESVQLAFWSQPGFVEYKYDESKDKLIRYMGGEEFIAEETQAPVEVQNVIIQYTTVRDAPNEGGRKLIETVGQGRADFFIHGKHIIGTWQRTGFDQPTMFYLDTGEEVTLTPGNTWIELHPDNKEVTVQNVDGTTTSYLNPAA